SAAGGGNASSAHTQQEAKNPNDQAKVDIEPRRDADDPMARGDVDAPEVLLDYSDFQCPFCGKFARDIAPEIVDKYVEEASCVSNGATSRIWEMTPGRAPRPDVRRPLRASSGSFMTRYTPISLRPTAAR